MKGIKAMKTQVLSTRVPVDVMSAIDELCKQNNVNRSQWLTETVAKQRSDSFMAKGGTIQARTIPLELENMLIAAGVTTVGILSFNVIGNFLTKEVDEDGKQKFTQGEIEIASVVSALAIAMLGYGVFKALSRDE
jgi:hypothetical protein